jgi:hypothetical protein
MQRYKDQVKNTATAYMNDDNCLILLTVSMQCSFPFCTRLNVAEFQLSEAVELANNLDKHGKRRIGISPLRRVVMYRSAHES